MCTVESGTKTSGQDRPVTRIVGADSKLRVETVDNWHTQWPAVLEFVQRSGQREALMIDADGWLSARQTVLAAFVGGQVVGYLSFRVEPIKSVQGSYVVENGRAALQAQVDAFHVDDAHCDSGIGHRLITCAEARAFTLRCQAFRKEMLDIC
jgi:Acetyltransferase (GNAT) family